MHSIAVASVVLAASQVAFSAPFPKGSGLGSSLAGSAASGAAGALVSNGLQEIESLFKREELETRGLGSTIATGAAKGAGGAVLSNGLSELESLFKREPKGGLGSSLAGSAASGAAGALVSNGLSELESLFKRAPVDLLDCPIIGKRQTSDAGCNTRPLLQLPSILGNESEIPELLETRGLGSSLAGSAASGAAGALVSNGLQEIESLFKREPKGSSGSSGLGSSLAGSAASGAAGALVSNGLSELESLFKRAPVDFSEDCPIIGKRQNSDAGCDTTSILNEIPELLGTRGLGSSLAGSAASGAAGALVSNGLQEIESLFKREPKGSSGSSGLGSTLAGSAASGAAGALVSNGLQEIESLFKRDSEGALFELVARDNTLTPTQKAGLIVALHNLPRSLHDLD
ncbi:hypothetical protein K439DRAFT_1637870 [Ramaria rubella]|nr:hypothetical protein K439DRAFT_1637870 [Ramaria rubella]